MISEILLKRGLRAVVSSVRVMKRGTVSVTLHFDPMDRDAALAIEPGASAVSAGAQQDEG